MNRFSFNVTRGILILGVVLYHLLYDLEFLMGFEINVSEYPILLLQKISAGGLLVLFGITTTIVGLDKTSVRKRFLKLLFWSFVISVVTYFYDKNNFVYFGILHLMAVSSLLGLLFLNLKNWLILVCAILFFILEEYIYIPTRPGLDYFPLLPWFGYILAGICIQKVKILKNIKIGENKLTKFLAWCGRHSMAIYLGHQVVIIAILTTFSFV